MSELSPLRRASALALAAAVSAAVAAGSMSAPAHAAADDPLLPPPGTCKRESDTGSHPSRTLAAACLINHIRTKSGLPALVHCQSVNTPPCQKPYPSAFKLFVSAAYGKAVDVMDCPRPLPNFGHNACDRQIDYWPKYYGYPIGSFGENIVFWNPTMTARQAVNWWMTHHIDEGKLEDTNEHRKNILSPDFTELGVGRASGGANSGDYWVAQFGRPSASPPQPAQPSPAQTTPAQTYDPAPAQNPQSSPAQTYRPSPYMMG